VLFLFLFQLFLFLLLCYIYALNGLLNMGLISVYIYLFLTALKSYYFGLTGEFKGSVLIGHILIRPVDIGSVRSSLLSRPGPFKVDQKLPSKIKTYLP